MNTSSFLEFFGLGSSSGSKANLSSHGFGSKVSSVLEQLHQELQVEYKLLMKFRSELEQHLTPDLYVRKYLETQRKLQQTLGPGAPLQNEDVIFLLELVKESLFRENKEKLFVAIKNCSKKVIASLNLYSPLLLIDSQPENEGLFSNVEEYKHLMAQIRQIVLEMGEINLTLEAEKSLQGCPKAKELFQHLKKISKRVENAGKESSKILSLEKQKIEGKARLVSGSLSSLSDLIQSLVCSLLASFEFDYYCEFTRADFEEELKGLLYDCLANNLKDKHSQELAYISKKVQEVNDAHLEEAIRIIHKEAEEFAKAPGADSKLSSYKLLYHRIWSDHLAIVKAEVEEALGFQPNAYFFLEPVMSPAKKSVYFKVEEAFARAIKNNLIYLDTDILMLVRDRFESFVRNGFQPFDWLGANKREIKEALLDLMHFTDFEVCLSHEWAQLRSKLKFISGQFFPELSSQELPPNPSGDNFSKPYNEESFFEKHPKSRTESEKKNIKALYTVALSTLETLSETQTVHVLADLYIIWMFSGQIFHSIRSSIESNEEIVFPELNVKERNWFIRLSRGVNNGMFRFINIQLVDLVEMVLEQLRVVHSVKIPGRRIIEKSEAPSRYVHDYNQPLLESKQALKPKELQFCNLKKERGVNELSDELTVSPELHGLDLQSIYRSRVNTVCVSGWTSQKDNHSISWGGALTHDHHREVFGLLWESGHVEGIINFAVQTIMGKEKPTGSENHINQNENMLGEAALILGKTFTTLALKAAGASNMMISGALASIQCYSIYKNNPFNSAYSIAIQTGQWLGRHFTLTRSYNNNCMNIVCFSLGTVLVFNFLLSLFENGVRNLVGDVVFMGSCVDIGILNKNWEKLVGPKKGVVQGKVINCFSTNDLVLRYLFRGAKIGQYPLGLSELDHLAAEECILKKENSLTESDRDQVRQYLKGKMETYDVSRFVNGHLDYRENIEKILRIIDFNTDFGSVFETGRETYLKEPKYQKKNKFF